MAVVMIDDPVDAAIRCLQLNLRDTIDLTGGKQNYINDADIGKVMESWGENTSVTSLDLSINQITDDGACAIAKALYEHQEGNLKNLELDSNRIKSEGCVTLFKHLPPSLTRLDLSANLFQDEAVLEGMQCLANGVAPNLTSLILRDNNELTNDSLAAIGKFLEDPNCKLSTLQVSGNAGFTDSGMLAFCGCLTNNRSLVDLNLSNCSISDYKDIVGALRDNEEIRQVTLAQNGARVNVPELDEILRRNKMIAIRRKSEVAMLKDQHEKDLKSQQQQHDHEISKLLDQVDQLNKDLEQEKAKNAKLEEEAANNNGNNTKAATPPPAEDAKKEEEEVKAATPPPEAPVEEEPKKEGETAAATEEEKAPPQEEEAAPQE